MENKCECKFINWTEYNEKKHDLEICKSCYCKYIKEEITYQEYENNCIFSKKNTGFKFKEICMVST